MESSDSLYLNITKNATFTVSLSSEPSSLTLTGYAIGGRDVAVYLLTGGDRLLVLNGSMLTEVDPGLDEDISEIIGLLNTSGNVSSEIQTRLDYAPGSRWDQDDNGREYTTSAIDFTVNGTTLAEGLDTAKLCTLWEIYSVYSGNLTTLCYGWDPCCKLYGIAATSGTKWDDVFYLPYGRFSTTEKNIVAARVIFSQT